MIILKSIDPARNRHRQYTIEIQPTLFGGHAVKARWGRIGAQRGQSRTYPGLTLEEATQHALRLVKLRQRHGYQITSINKV